MNDIPNKIKLNKDLWFTVLGNKLVFGNSSLSNGFHYTFSDLPPQNCTNLK